MSHLVVAVLASVVAVQYAVIAAYVVPRLGALVEEPSRTVRVAEVGAVAFFAGCALTHLGIAVQGVHTDDGGAVLVQHVLPHIAQVVGGAIFILVVHSRLEISIASKSSAARLRRLELEYRAAFLSAPVGIALVEVDAGGAGRTLQANPALCAMVGHTREELEGQPFRPRLVHPGDRHLSDDALGRMLDGETDRVELQQRYVHRDGHEIWVTVEASLVRGDDGEALFSVAQIRDVTDERRRQAELQFLAEHDSLTGLFNRRRFEEELDRTVNVVRRYAEPAGLLVVDLDQFKYINDTYGHGVGDDLIRAVAAVLSSRLRDTDVIGRLGGDEFGVLLPHTSEEGAVAVGTALLDALRAEAHVVVGTRTVRASASVGVRGIAADDPANGEQLLAEADIAMYEAKENGRDRVSLVPAGGVGPARMRARLTWSERIRDALDSGGFTLFEQPILNLATGVCDRSELLVRMIDPADGSLIPPARFLYVAERFGQIGGIDRWVFERAVELLERRRRAGDDRALEVNLSGTSLTDERLIAEISDWVRSADIDPTRLIVEVTETAAITNMEVARSFAARLSDLGCRFALDDFGSGFGSFYYLKHLPFNGVKIDGDFIKDLPASTTDQLTLEAIMVISRGLGKETTAEFVQDDETLDLLRRHGVGFAQGYHVAMPMAVPEMALLTGSGQPQPRA